MSSAVAWGLAALAGASCAALLVALYRARRAVRQAKSAQRVADDEVTGLQRQGARFAAALEGMEQGIILLDEGRRIVAWNAAARQLTGDPPELAKGRPMASAPAWGALTRALDEVAGAEVAAETTFERSGPPHDDGTERALLVRVYALDGRGYAVVFEDQSRLRQLESVRRDFVANVSHELKTPLAAIKGFVETLLDDAEMSAVTRQGFLARIGRQSDRLNSLVADLLTLSRLDEQVQTSPGTSDLGAVIRETLRDLQPLAERGGVALGAEGTEGATEVRGGSEALRQVVGNLVDNAIKYTPAGGAVTVRLQPGPERVRVEVEDTGIGLRPEDQRRVFERFYRVDRARSRELGGTGLGLSIAKNTVRGLGGEIGVRSAPGRGSTFWVTLPRR